MSRMFPLFTGIVFYCVVMASASAQDAKIGVRVNHSGDDSVGQRLAYAVRENVRSSNGFKLEQEKWILRVSLVTLDPENNPGSRGNWTVVSMVITMSNFIPYEKGNPQTWLPIFLTSSVYTVGSTRVDDQAKAIMASVDQALDDYLAAARKN